MSTFLTINKTKAGSGKLQPWLIDNGVRPKNICFVRATRPYLAKPPDPKVFRQIGIFFSFFKAIFAVLTGTFWT